MKISDLKVGDKVKGFESNGEELYTGVIACIHPDSRYGRTACVERDDGRHGGGCLGRWRVAERNGVVMSDGSTGNPLQFMCVDISEDILVEKIIKKYKREQNNQIFAIERSNHSRGGRQSKKVN